MFDQAEAASHLLRRGLIPRAGNSSSVTLSRLAGRNLVFRIEFEGTAPILLKRAVDAETRRGLEREARAYDLIFESGDRVSPAVPRKLDFDPRSSTLVLEFLSSHRPLAHPSRLEEWSPALAEALGRILARIHAILPPGGDTSPPWILSLVHPPIGILREASYGQLDLMGHVQGSIVWRSALENLAEEWRPRSFVHGDLRLSNILVEDLPSNDPQLAFIDWELAGCGDASWDAGWALAEILAGRLGRLSEAFPLVRAFWAGYHTPARDSGTHARLDYTLRWSAAACLQMAYEESRWPHLGPSPTDKLLELGRSLLERPAVWIERVFTPPGR